MTTLILQLLFLTVVFFIFLRYDLGKSFKKSLSRAILIGLMIGILYILLQQPTIEGIVAYDCSTNAPLTFGAKTNDTDTFGSKTNDTDTFGSKTSDTDTFGSKINDMNTFGSKINDMNRFGSKTSDMDTLGSKTSDTNTFDDKLRNGYNHEHLFKSIIEKVYHTKLPMDKKWQDDNNFFSACK